MKRHPSILLVLAVAMTVFFACNSKQASKDGNAGDQQLSAEDSATAIEQVDPSKLRGKGEEFDISLQFKKGDVFGFSIKTVEDVKFSRDSVTEHNKQTIQFDYKFEVIEPLPDGGARLKATCLAVKFDGNYQGEQGNRSMSYDSKIKYDRDKEKTFAQYNAPVNTPYEAVITGEGKVTEVSNVDNILKRLLLDDYKTTKLEAKQMLEREYGENSLKNIIQLAFQKFDRKPVKVDSNWNIIWSGKIGFMQVRNTATYTLMGYEAAAGGRIAHIRAKLKSEYLGQKTFDTGQGLATVEGFSIGGQGVSTFNLDSGKPVTRKMKQKLYAKFFIQPPEELKKMAPDQAKDFYMIQDAVIENEVTPLVF